MSGTELEVMATDSGGGGASGDGAGGADGGSMSRKKSDKVPLAGGERTTKQELPQYPQKHVEFDKNPLTGKVTGAVTKYDAEWLHNWGALTHVASTCVSDAFMSKQLCLMLTVTTVIAVTGAALANNDHNSAIMQKLSQDWQRTLNLSIQVVSFLMALWNGQVIARWWATRVKLGIVIGRANDVAMQLSAYIPGTDEASVAARAKIVRLINAAHGLVYIQCANNPNEDITDLCTKEHHSLLTPDEAEKLRHEVSRYGCCCGMALQSLMQAAADKLVFMPHVAVPLIAGNISAIRGAAADVLMFVGTQLPFALAHLLTILAKGVLLAKSIQEGFEIARQWHNAEPVHRSNDIVTGVFSIWLTNVVFQSLMSLNAMLHNPFREKSNHFPRHNFMLTTFKSSSTICQSVCGLPSKEQHPDLFDMSASSGAPIGYAAAAVLPK